MKFFYLCILSVAFLLASPGFAHEPDLIYVLNILGLTKYASLLTRHAPGLVTEISRRNDITIWAPGNAAITASDYWSSRLGKRGTPEEANLNTTATGGSDPNKGTTGWDKLRRRGLGLWKRTIGTRNYPDSNFETIYTFLRDPQFINLGKDERLRFVKNYGSPIDGGVESPAIIEVTTGLGHVKNTLRGPFKFKNGVIYEVTHFFSLPEAFTTTMDYLNISRQFYDLVEETGNLDLFEITPAVTIFAPIDDFGIVDVDPKSHILQEDDGPALFLTPELIPGITVTSVSGDKIEITRSETGEPLANGRRITKPNVVTKNGVIHFIEGPIIMMYSHFMDPKITPMVHIKGNLGRWYGLETTVSSECKEVDVMGKAPPVFSRKRNSN